jgi:hypothetical protein
VVAAGRAFWRLGRRLGGAHGARPYRLKRRACVGGGGKFRTQRGHGSLLDVRRFSDRPYAQARIARDICGGARWRRR